MNPASTPTDCLCDEQLAALTSGVMAEPELGQVIAHVADCEDCRSLVGDLLAQNTAIPAVIGRYQIEASLGAGGMGVVLRAHDPVLQRQVALKMLHANLAAPAHRERMLQEARALAKLSHPNIVPVFDCGDADGEVYLAMELIEGEPMQHWLAQTRKRDARVAVALGVGAALVAVHKAGLLHRDIKPS
ncbi:MAG TPA: serine/threonine-protein kinase, partial [Kofleriaceae bacterium]|nr:serine/threonine-protein kinase [Kofleriaceae bacterium]